jgi:ribosomal protein S18 acetylase RimI-like enzyme
VVRFAADGGAEIADARAAVAAARHTPRWCTAQRSESRGMRNEARSEEPPTAAPALPCIELDRPGAAAALEIWRDAAQWLVDGGRPLWSPSIFDEDFVDDAQTRGIILGAIVDERVGGVALLQWRDELWWPDRPPDGAAYIHKVAVARAAAGRGAADALVDACERRARARGSGIVRLDTAADRPALRALYERLGYVAIDLRRVGSLLGVRYEKRL